MKVLHWNVEKGLGLLANNTNAQAQAIARVLNFHHPDVMLFNETASSSVASNQLALIHFVTNNLPYLGTNFYVSVSTQTDGFNRNSAISRYPILADTTYDDGLRGLHAIRLQLTGTNQLQVFHAHLKCCSVAGDCDRRQSNAVFSATTIAAWAATNSTAYIFGGDWNEDEQNPECTITGTYHPITTIRETGHLVEFKPTDLNGEYRTWSTATTAPSIRFDYLLAATNRLSPTSGFIFNSKTWSTQGLYTNPATDSATASDHYPVIANYFFPSGPPYIFAVTATNVGDTTATIRWNTDTTASSLVLYGTNTATSAGLVTNHTVNLTGLARGTQYFYSVVSTNSLGATTNDNAYTFTTTILTLYNVAATNVTDTTASILWNTDRPSDSRVRYWPRPTGVTNSTYIASLVTNHTVNLTGLTAGKTYEFDVISVASPDTITNNNNGAHFEFTTQTKLTAFADNFETGTNGWSASGLWHIHGTTTCSNYVSSTHSWWYGYSHSGNCDYNTNFTGNGNSGTLTTPAIVLGTNYSLQVQSWEDTEGTSTRWDTRKVYIATNNTFSIWTLLFQSTNDSKSWHALGPIILSNFNGRTAKFRFEFNTVDNSDNAFGGWYLDDFQVYRLGLPAGPVAEAGPTQAADTGSLVTLTGSSSTGSNLTFAWTQTAGKPVTLSSATATNPTFTAPSVGSLAEAALNFSLTVTDAFGRRTSDVAIVNINLPNPPVADAGTNLTVEPGTLVTLDGSASTGIGLAYVWTQLTGKPVTLSGNTFTAPTVTNAAHGTLTFQLTVTDDFERSASSNVVITVVPPPIVTSVTPNKGATAGGQNVTIAGEAFLDGATVSINGNAATSVTVVGPTQITVVTPANTAGPHNVTVTNPDGQSGTLTNGYTDFALAADFTGTPVIGPAPLTVTFTNLTSGTLTNSLWTFGDSGTTNTTNPTHTYTNAGTYTVRLDAFGTEGSDSISRTNYIQITPAAVRLWLGAGTSGLTNNAGTLTVWSTNQNWSGGAPASDSEAVVNVSTNGTLTLNANTTISKLTVTGTTTALRFNLLGTSLTVTNAGVTEIAATTTQTLGTVSVPNGELRLGGVYAMTSGLLSGNVIRVTGTFRTVGGTFTISSAFVNEGTFTAARVSATSTLTFQSGTLFSNAPGGRIVVETNALLLITNTLVNAGMIEARNTGTFGTSTGGWFTNAPTGVILNTNSAATLFIRANSGSFANAGAVVVSNNATIAFLSATAAQVVTNTGQFLLGDSASYGVINLGTLNNQGLISGQGTLHLNARPLTNGPAATISLTGLLFVTNVTQVANAGSVNIGSGELRMLNTNGLLATLNTGTITLSGGTLSFAGALTNRPTGTVRGCGTITNAVVVNAGTINVECAFTFSELVTNAGTIRGSGTITAPVLINTGTINADVAGTNLVFTGSVTNNGLVTANGGTLIFYGPFVNNGTLVTTNGSVQFLGSVTNTGAYFLDPLGDADGDGLPNGWETTYGLNPFDPNSDADPDNDGLSNAQEFALATNPTAADSDGDGMTDGWEVAHSLDPVLSNGTVDSDGDGQSNLAEYLAGTDPQDVASIFGVFNFTSDGGTDVVAWSSVEGKAYVPQISTNIIYGWSSLGLVITAGVRETTLTLTNPISSTTNRYYRILLQQP